MNAQSASKTKRLAAIGLVLGILSSGLFLLACLILIWIKLSPFDEFRALALLGQVAILLLGSLILGLPGFVLALIALLRIRKEENIHKTPGMVIMGLALGGLGPAVILILLGYIILFNSSAPPPVMVTPSSIIPLPTDG